MGQFCFPLTWGLRGKTELWHLEVALRARGSGAPIIPASRRLGLENPVQPVLRTHPD